MELDFWMNKIQDRRSLLFKVFNVSVIFFHVYFDKKVHKKTGKQIKQAKKIQTLNFAESNVH